MAPEKKVTYRLQFRLRTLLLLLTIVAISLSTIVGVVKPILRRHKAIQAISELGGTFEFSKRASDNTLYRQILASVLPRKLVDPVERVVLSGTNASDDILRELESIPELTSLHLDYTQVSDEGLPSLEQFKMLEVVCLNSSRVTDRGLIHCQHLRHLRVLRLSGTRTRNEGLSYLHDLENLQELTLGNTKVDDAGMKYLEHLSQLRHLELNEKVTASSLEDLRAKLPMCKIIHVHH